MAGHEERELRRLKRELKRTTAKKNRARVRDSLHDADYEAAAEDAAVPERDQTAGIHVGRNKPRDLEPVEKPVDSNLDATRSRAETEREDGAG